MRPGKVNMDKVKTPGPRGLGNPGGDFFIEVPQGISVWYIPPPLDSMEGDIYIDYNVHDRIGPGNGRSVVCLGEDNVSVWSDSLVTKKKIRLADGCAACDAMKNPPPDTTDKQVEGFQRKTKSLIPAVLVGTVNGEGDFSEAVPKQCGVIRQSTAFRDKIRKLFKKWGDISDPDCARYIEVERTGQKLMTRYEVAIYAETASNPVKIHKSIHRLVDEHYVEGGDADPFVVLGKLITENADVEKMIKGESIEKSSGAEPGHEACFGKDFELKDSGCKSCREYRACGKASGVEIPGGDEEPVAAKRRPAPPPDDEPVVTKRRPAPPPDDDEPLPAKKRTVVSDEAAPKAGGLIRKSATDMVKDMEAKSKKRVDDDEADDVPPALGGKGRRPQTETPEADPNDFLGEEGGMDFGEDVDALTQSLKKNQKGK